METLGKTATSYDVAASYDVTDVEVPGVEVSKLIAAAIGIGTIAGLRSMTAPAVVSLAANREWIHKPTNGLALLANSKTAFVLSALAMGELVIDKLPTTPNRTEPFALTARVVSGGLSAVALTESKNVAVVAALLGGLSAVAGAFIGFQLRKRAGRNFNLPDAVIALTEDAIAVGGRVPGCANAAPPVNPHFSQNEITNRP